MRSGSKPIPNNNDTDGDGLTDGEEDANHNGIVDLAIIDRNQTDASGNFKVLATFTSPTQFVTVQGLDQQLRPTSGVRHYWPQRRSSTR